MTSTNASSSTSTTSKKEKKKIRILALHGSGGDAEEFPQRLATLQTALEGSSSKVEITAMDAPHVQPAGGYSWWTMPPGVRSFTATEYGGFDVSAQKVLEIWKNHGPFDVILGHSQGAILIASLLALQKIPYHPSMGYVFNGVSFPNPYRSQLSELTFASSADQKEVPRVLFVMGTNDKITPNETGEELRDTLQQAGMKVSTIKHPAGHGVPNAMDDTMESMTSWILSSATAS